MATEAVLQTLRQIWKLLRDAEIPAAVAGGLALATWRHPRTTFDVDILVMADGPALSDLTTKLARAGFSRKNELPVDLGDTELMQFSIEPEGAFIDVQVDLLRAKSEYAREAIGRGVILGKDALGFTIKVLACEDLILFKLLAGRIIDLADAAALLRANAGALDEDLLDRLAVRLRVEAALEQVRREARD
jgi:hypothetical protein